MAAQNENPDSQQFPEAPAKKALVQGIADWGIGKKDKQVMVAFAEFLNGLVPMCGQQKGLFSRA